MNHGGIFQMNLGRMPNPLLNKSFLSQFPTFKSFRKKRKMLSLLVIRDQNHEKNFFLRVIPFEFLQQRAVSR